MHITAGSAFKDCRNAGRSSVAPYVSVMAQRTKDLARNHKSVLVKSDKQTAAELAQMKRQMVAIEQASISKKCNIQFQGKPQGN